MDTSDKIVRKGNLKALSAFERAIARGDVGPKEVHELKAIVDKNGVNSVEYTDFLTKAYAKLTGRIL